MTKPRKELVSVSDTPYYYIVLRCVRRIFLCGYVHQCNTDYEHRKDWIVDWVHLPSALLLLILIAMPS